MSSVPATVSVTQDRTSSGAMTQDDGMVGYFFQRDSSSDPEFQQPQQQQQQANQQQSTTGNKANNGSSVGGQAVVASNNNTILSNNNTSSGNNSGIRATGWGQLDDPQDNGTNSSRNLSSDASELESDFQALALESEPLSVSKKIWGLDENSGSGGSSSVPGKHSRHHHSQSSQPHSNHHHHHSNHHHVETSKGLLFSESGWSSSTWSSGQSDHAVSDPILVGSNRRFAGNNNDGAGGGPILSPRSQEGLGVKMVEYVLGTSPVQKDLENRMANLRHLTTGAGDHHSNDHKGKKNHPRHRIGKQEETVSASNGSSSNGVAIGLSNGLEDESKMFNRTPGSGTIVSHPEDGDKNSVHMPPSDPLDPMHKFKLVDASATGMLPASGMSHPGFEFGDGNHAVPGLDHPNSMFQDYHNQMMMAGGDSSSLLESQMYHHHYQQQQRAAAAAAAAAAGPNGQMQGMMHHPQQQFQQMAGGPNGQPAPPHHANSGPGNGFPQNPYYQDPFAAQMGHMIPAGPPPPPPAAMMPPYYGMPAAWGMYPGMMQGQGQAGGGPSGPHMQQMMGRNASSGRPQSPGSSDSSSQAAGQMSGAAAASAGQFAQMMPPHAYYEQMMAAAGSQAGMGRGMNPMRMMPQHMMMNANNARMMTNQNGQQVNHSGQLFPNSSNGFNGSGAGSGGLPFHNGSSALNGSGFSHMGHNGQGYGNSLGPIGGGLGASSPTRRDSFDRRDSFSSIGGFGLDSQFGPPPPRHLGSKNQFNPYGFGTSISASPSPIGMMPNSSPPPINGSLGLGLGSNRMSAAPGENKYMRNGGGGGHMGSMFGGGGGIGGHSSGHHHMGFNSRNSLLQRNSSMDKSTGRSRLLEDFRNNRYPNLQLRDLTDHMVEFSQDQHGSRFIQQKLERANPQEKQLVFNEILPSAYNLMTDVFGNYVIQKFFEFGSPEQKQQLAIKVKGHVLPLALQMYGCRVIQKALESIPPEQQKEIVKELDGHVLKCVKDQNGNHVVQKCIECVDPHALQFIINSFQGQVCVCVSVSLSFFHSIPFPDDALQPLFLPDDQTPAKKEREADLMFSH